MMPSRARVAGLLLATAAGAGAPAPVTAEAVFDRQRLFTTAGERAAIDAARGAKPAAAEIGAASDRKAGTGVVERRIHLRGLVVRGDGAVQVWLDAPPDVHYHHVGGDRVRVHDGDAHSAELRPGQSWLPASGQVRDRHEH